MLFKASIKSNKTEILAREYAKLINSGINSSKILVLCQNSYKKNNFKEFALNFIQKKATEGLEIYSFSGFVRNVINAHWTFFEDKIKSGTPKIEPNLGGLEISQYIFKKCIEKLEFKGYNSKNNLLHQLFKRYTLICHNALSDSDVEKKVQFLDESFSKECKNAINLYRAKTLNLRSFDYLRQIEAFSYIYQNIPNNYEYVFLDDGDEITPVMFEYLKFLKPLIKKFYIAYDPFGTSRMGYLSAICPCFETFLDEKPIKIKCDETFENSILNKIQNNEPIISNKLEINEFVRRDEQIEETILKINNLLKNGVKPNEIALVTPNTDCFLKFYLKKIKAPVFSFAGDEKLSKNPVVAGILTILKKINGKNVNFSNPQTRSIMLNILNLDFNVALNLSNLCTLKNDFVDFEDEKYKYFLKVLSNIKNKPLSYQFFTLCDEFIELSIKNKKNVEKLNAILKQITDFEEVFGYDKAKDYLLEALDYTIISENPVKSEEYDANSIILATPQKIIDNEIKIKYLFLLDTSSDNWTKQDIGPLYNAWVLNANWNDKKFTLDDSIKLQKEKISRILRKLFLLNSNKIFIYSSIYDFEANENIGGISKFFKNSEKIVSKNTITPRPDQIPVLNYKKGKMGVNAVAGSGKTTIALALIMKLLNEGVNPSNIFVLTFMDSAAKNFKERIKKNFPNLQELPHISTLHGLSLRILKENNNYRYLGLDDNFEIIDEMQSQNIIISILGEEYSKKDTYIKAISAFKNDGNKYIKKPAFKKIFEAYQKYLKENNLLDYDDLLSYALKLLEENKEILSYYQNLSQYILEDEAQDSTPIQQKLISYLSLKWGNVIRVGDVNQSIMTTFSNSDTEGFKKFVKENNSYYMNHSQRCSKGVYTLANSLIKYAIKNNVDAFLDVEMKPVEGKNPKNEKEVVIKTFDVEKDEKTYILNEIKNIMSKDKKATIAILLRSNFEADNWAKFLSDFNIKTKTRSDMLNSNPVFKVVFAILTFILNPDNNQVLNVAKILSDLNFINNYSELEKTIKSLSNKNFITSNFEDYPIWWDLREFLLSSKENIVELSLKIADYYFGKTSHSANIALIVGIIEKIANKEKDFEQILLKLEYIANKNKKATSKFFKIKENTTSTIEIMTLHKSKGDEFDYVFIPKLTDDNITLSNNVKIKDKAETLFIESVKKNPKTEDEIKNEIIKENHRLLYVALTRAKQRVYLTTSFEYKIFNKAKKIEPCMFLKENLNNVQNF